MVSSKGCENEKNVKKNHLGRCVWISKEGARGVLGLAQQQCGGQKQRGRERCSKESKGAFHRRILAQVFKIRQNLFLKFLIVLKFPKK
jgi:hypothetical protein